MLLHSGRRTGPQHELDSKEKKKEKEFKNECVKRKLQIHIKIFFILLFTTYNIYNIFILLLLLRQQELGILF